MKDNKSDFQVPRKYSPGILTKIIHNGLIHLIKMIEEINNFSKLFLHI